MNIPVQAGQLPQGFCPSTFQAMAVAFAAIYSVNVGAQTGINVVVQPGQPSQQNVLWLQTDSLGRPIRFYYYGQGAWLSLHPLVPGLTMWWFQVLPNFTQFDGGDSNALGPQSGPMWQQALDVNGNVIAAKFPVAAGTLPSGTVLVNGGTGGEEKHILVDAEQTVPSTHQHVYGRADAANSREAAFAKSTGTDTSPNSTGPLIGYAGSYSEVPLGNQQGVYLETASVAQPQPAAGHNTLPCYIVGYLIQRTSRLFYSVS